MVSVETPVAVADESARRLTGPRWKAGLGAALLLAWSSGVSLLLGALMVPHWVGLPAPQAAQSLPSALARDAAQGRWSVYHVLFADCPCSRSLLAALVEQPPSGELARQAHQRALLVGADPALAERLLRAGYEVRNPTAAELASDYGAEAAPLLLVVDPAGRLRYSGGYSPRKRGLDLQHNAILQQLLQGQEVTALPVFGCGVSTRLQAALDPLRLKY
jgi:hypothetical protein